MKEAPPVGGRKVVAERVDADHMTQPIERANEWAAGGKRKTRGTAYRPT
jgi:hypothetical protein